MAAGKPQKQAVAIALSNARRHPKGGFGTGGRAYADGGVSSGTALSFVPTPPAGGVSTTQTPPVSYNSSMPATSPNFGPIVAQVDRFGMPQNTPNATLADSAGKQVQMYDPSSFVNPLNSMMPANTATPTTPTVPTAQQNAINQALFTVPSQANNSQWMSHLTTPQLSALLASIGSPSYRPNGNFGSDFTSDQQTKINDYLLQNNIPISGLKKGGRVNKFASGGPSTAEADPWYMRSEARGVMHPEGLIASHGAGRTDVHNISVPSGSYILPADVVSGIGEGNTLAGASVIDKMMHALPYGIQGSHHGGGGSMGIPRAPAAHMMKQDEDFEPVKRGGTPKDKGHGEAVPIVVAGGEVLLHPGTLIQKFGSLKKAHAVLDKFVLNARHQTIKDTRALKGPKK